jgi:GntR family transcriptional regulator
MKFLSNQAIYLQICDYICENILLKKWLPGDRIPSIREMAVNIEVNPNTVMRSYSHLQDMDIIQNQRGIGYFVSAKGYENTKKLKTKAFIEQDLPRLFRTMQLLGFKLSDLKSYYDKSNKNQEES